MLRDHHKQRSLTTLLLSKYKDGVFYTDSHFQIDLYMNDLNLGKNQKVILSVYTVI